MSNDSLKIENKDKDNIDISEIHDIQVENEFDNCRLDRFLTEKFKDMSRSFIQKQIKDGLVKVNGKAVKSSYKLQSGDNVQMSICEPKDTAIVPENIPLDIIYEDDDILVINKKPDIAMHESHNHRCDALSNAVAFHLMKEGKECVFRSVGRLDKGTSGIVVCALNKFSAAKLSGKIYKEYLAVAGGEFYGDGVIDKPIIRPDPMKTLRDVGVGGERAVTHWKSLKVKDGCTLLRIHLETGRTHQIRVHFKSLGAPLVGDDMYGSTDKRLSHQALHCCFVRFTHPVTEQIMEFTAPMPDDMNKLT